LRSDRLLLCTCAVLALILLAQASFSGSLAANPRPLGGSGIVPVPKATVSVISVNIYDQTNSQSSTGIYYVQVSLVASQPGSYVVYLELYNGGSLIFSANQGASLSATPTTLTFALPSQAAQGSSVQVVIYAKT
jgi:hypothetical protein